MGVADDRFLSVYGVTLQEGRFFDGRDSASSPRVAVVDRRFAERFSANTPILGRQFRLDPQNAQGTIVTIVGVINNIMLNTQQQPVQTTLLVPSRQAPFHVGSVTVRVVENAAITETSLNAVTREVDVDTPLAFHDYDSILHGQTRTAHTFAIAFYVLGIVSFALVGIGLYGVMAVSVRRRTREIGVPRALGSPNRKILTALFTRSAVQVVIGLALGFCAGVPFARLLDSSLLQFGNSMDPRVLIGSIVLIGFAATIAVLVPAGRAIRVDPAQVLHFE